MTRQPTTTTQYNSKNSSVRWNIARGIDPTTGNAYHVYTRQSGRVQSWDRNWVFDQATSEVAFAAAEAFDAFDPRTDDVCESVRSTAYLEKIDSRTLVVWF